MESGPDAPGPRDLTGSPDELAASASSDARRQATQRIFAHEAALEAKRNEALVRPGFRERVEELLREGWHEPVLVLRLGDAADLVFDVPGRRSDGTIKRKKLLRRFFWNIARGIGAAVAYVLYLASSAGSGRTSTKRQVHVKGPADAMALDLLDKFRAAKGPWLACSPSWLAIVDTGSTMADPAKAMAPQLVWEARKPQAPRISLRTRTLTWPDGSSFTFPLHDRAEEQHLRNSREKHAGSA